MAKTNFTPTTQRGENRAQGFTYRQVQIAFKHLLEEEAPLIQDDRLPLRTSLVAELFARMSFDCCFWIDRDSISEKQATLITQYN